MKLIVLCSENSTGKYPDLAARMPSHLQPGVNSIVIDGEVVAYDVEEDRMRPFQVTDLSSYVPHSTRCCNGS